MDGVGYTEKRRVLEHEGKKMRPRGKAEGEQMVKYWANGRISVTTYQPQCWTASSSEIFQVLVM